MALSLFLVGRSNFFLINHVNCNLNAYVCPLNLEPLLLSFIGKNIFELKTGAISRQIASHDPVLTNIKVEKFLPNRLKINLTRRIPIVLVRRDSDDSEYYLDKLGFIFKLPLPYNQPLPQVYWPSDLPLIEGDSMNGQDLAKLINTLAAYYVNYEQIIRQAEKIYIVKTSLGPEAIIIAESDYAPMVASLQFILSNLKMEDKLPEKIDLRFDKPILTY